MVAYAAILLGPALRIHHRATHVDATKIEVMRPGMPWRGALARLLLLTATGLSPNEVGESEVGELEQWHDTG